MSSSKPFSIWKARAQEMMERHNKDYQGAWMPTESAPKDGSHILLYRTDQQFVGYYANGECWCHNAPGVPIVNPPPTHWMPLPEPPK